MEETVYLFCTRKQFTRWIAENCGKCRARFAGVPGCHLSDAVTEAQLLEGVVPLPLAERIGYFDVDGDDRHGSPDTWTCREFRLADGPLRRSPPAGG